MHYHWLNKKDNHKLIVFFTGWSFDYKPFEFLNCDGFDVLMFYDYNDLNLQINPDFSKYKETYLIAWSMGVFTAYQLRNKLPDFTKKIAVNGTAFPVDDEYGIPLKPFLLTLRHAKTGLEGKFYQNIFDNPKEYETYIKNPVERTIENRVEELQNLYEMIKNCEKTYETFYDSAIISTNDKIIPPKNQMNFWKDKAKTIESGHFPYYRFKNWNEIICR